MLHPLLVSALVLAVTPGTVAAADGSTAVPVERFDERPLDGSPCTGKGWQQRRGLRALATLGNPSASGFRLVFTSHRDGYYAMTRPRIRSIEVYVRACHEQSQEMLEHVLAHELGHAHDAARLDDGDRRAWRDQRGLERDQHWYGCDECGDFGTPAGDYAETYAQWLRGDSRNLSRLAQPADQAELKRLGRRFFTT
jgi:hypothetical protein